MLASVLSQPSPTVPYYGSVLVPKPSRQIIYQGNPSTRRPILSRRPIRRQSLDQSLLELLAGMCWTPPWPMAEHFRHKLMVGVKGPKSCMTPATPTADPIGRAFCQAVEQPHGSCMRWGGLRVGSFMIRALGQGLQGRLSGRQGVNPSTQSDFTLLCLII